MIVINALDRSKLLQKLASMEMGVHFPARGAGGVQCNLARRAPVCQLHPADFQQELGQLESALGERFYPLERVRLIGKQRRVMVPEHPGTGAGRHHDRQTRLIEDIQLGAGHCLGLIPISGSPGGLPATALLLGEMHANTFPLQQANGIQPGLRKEQIHHAGTEQSDRFRLLRVMPVGFPLGRYPGGIGSGIVKQLTH